MSTSERPPRPASPRRSLLRALFLLGLGVAAPALADPPVDELDAREVADTLSEPREPQPEPVALQARMVFFPFQLLEGTLAIEGELSVGRYFSVGLMAELLLYDSLFLDEWNVGLRSYGATLTPRIYPLGKGPAGLWIGPELRVAHLERAGAEISGIGWSAGGVAGYAWSWERFTFVSAAGARYVERILRDEVGAEVGRSSGVGFSYRLGLGLLLD